ncbi:MAG: pantoate--beta-alanine ligase [Pirellulaceae bacterium]
MHLNGVQHHCHTASTTKVLPQVKVTESLHEAYAHVDYWRREGLKVGLVPTMGALHEGHLSLVNRGASECEKMAASIFVNPTQFGPNEDLDRYPRTLDADLEALQAAGVELVFVPKPTTLYPSGFSTYIQPPANSLPLEGAFRPGHFRGVATVVLKLFQILPAHVAYFGQKDFQQLAVIRAMVHDLNLPIRVVGCPTMREPDGLAMSSRNRYLSESERKRSLCISRALDAAEALVLRGEREVAALEAEMTQILLNHTDSVDYAVIVDCDSLEAVQELQTEAVALIACYVGKTRLIDNRVLSIETE